MNRSTNPTKRRRRIAAALATADVEPAQAVIDITNPLTAGYMGLQIGHSTSAAEEIAKAVPKASVAALA